VRKVVIASGRVYRVSASPLQRKKEIRAAMEQFTDSVNDQWEISEPRPRQAAEGNIPFCLKNSTSKKNFFHF
jgi:hypothetical protein